MQGTFKKKCSVFFSCCKTQKCGISPDDPEDERSSKKPGYIGFNDDNRGSAILTS